MTRSFKILPPTVLFAWVLSAASGWGQTVTVNTSDDQFDTPSGPGISLREAIRDLSTTGGTIEFIPSIRTLELDSPLVSSSTGSTIKIDGGGVVTISAAAGFSGTYLMELRNRSFNFENLAIRGPGLEATSGPESGAIFEDGIGRLENCEVTDWPSIGLYYNNSGAWANVLGTTFFRNNEGIRFFQARNVWIEDSVFYHHRGFALNGSGSATANGGDGTSLRVSNVTLAENSGSRTMRFTGTFGQSDAFDIRFTSVVDNSGVGLEAPASLRVEHSVFARNIPPGGAGDSVSLWESGGSTGADSLGFNRTDDSPASMDHPEDITGSPVLISRLGDFGGDRLCCFPLDGSSLIDGGNPNRSFSPQGDGRGFDRKARNSLQTALGNLADIGAVETNPEGTLVVTTRASGTGTGTLGSALAAATGETAHIVFRLSTFLNDFSLTQTIQVDQAMNFNLDGSSVGFAGSPSTGPLWEIGNTSGSATTVSMHGFKFVDDLSDGATDGGCILVRPNARLSLHRCSFENNEAAGMGVVDGAGSSLGFAGLFINECRFVDNEQINSTGSPNEGGTALRLERAVATVWNSTFLRNRCLELPLSFTSDGGAVRLGTSARARFRQCTFADNEVGWNGAAIFVEDNSALADTLELDRCTFARNRTGSLGEGAIGLANRARLIVRNTVFTGNLNDGDPSESPSTRDLFAADASAVTLLEAELNWSDAPAAFAGLIEPGNLGFPVRLAPPADWGGEVPTMPWIRGSEPPTDELGALRRYARDAANDTGFSFQSSLSLPGAVQSSFAQDSILEVSVVGRSATELSVEVTGRAGIEWELEESADLTGFAPTGQTYTAGAAPTILALPLPSPTPDAYFFRFVDVVPGP